MLRSAGDEDIGLEGVWTGGVTYGAKVVEERRHKDGAWVAWDSAPGVRIAFALGWGSACPAEPCRAPAVRAGGSSG